MSDEQFEKDKEVLELKIAHLLNEFTQMRNTAIDHIWVNYGPCDKGWFPDVVINVNVETHATLEIPCAGVCNERDDELHRRIFSSQREEEK